MKFNLTAIETMINNVFDYWFVVTCGESGGHAILSIDADTMMDFIFTMSCIILAIIVIALAIILPLMANNHKNSNKMLNANNKIDNIKQAYESVKNDIKRTNKLCYDKLERIGKLNRVHEELEVENDLLKKENK